MLFFIKSIYQKIRFISAMFARTMDNLEFIQDSPQTVVCKIVVFQGKDNSELASIYANKIDSYLDEMYILQNRMNKNKDLSTN